MDNPLTRIPWLKNSDENVNSTNGGLKTCACMYLLQNPSPSMTSLLHFSDKFVTCMCNVPHRSCWMAW